MSHPRVRRLDPDDWPILRDLRLAALADSPEAFASTLAGEQHLTETDWRDRLRSDRAMSAVGYVGEEPAGLVGALLPTGEQSTVELVSMWVRPDRRGRGLGVGAALVRAVLEWTAANRHGDIGLWVVDGNRRASRLYERHGFRLTGESKPHPNAADIRELRMLYRSNSIESPNSCHR